MTPYGVLLRRGAELPISSDGQAIAILVDDIDALFSSLLNRGLDVTKSAIRAESRLAISGPSSTN
jgi:hypothetical protein